MNYIKLLLLLFSFSYLYSQDGVVVNFDSLRPKVALALSGGGARGAAQIGILQSFEENNIMVDYIAGTSVGSLVGGLYAAGYTPNELDSIISGTDWDKLISISNPNSRNSLFIDQKQIYDRNLINLKFNNFDFIEPSGLSIGTRFTEFLQKLFLNSIYQTKNDFNKLKYPFRAVATDLVSGESISFKSGNIVNVIKASATVPLRFAPIRLDSMILIDGGILANIPVNAAKEFNPDLIISINTTSPLLEYDDINAGWDIADQAISIAMREFQEKAAAESDIFITPKINHSNTDFTNLDTLVKTGYEAGKENIQLVKEFLIAEEKFRYQNFFVDYPDLWNINNKNIEFENFKNDDISHLQNKTYDNIYEILNAIKNKEIYNEVQVFKINNSIILKAIHYPIIRRVDYEGIINEEVIGFSKVLEKEIINTYLTKEKEAEIYERILKKYRDLGYAAASIEKLEFDDSTKTLNLSIDEGLINSITITGNYNTRNFIIKRDITFKVGEPVNLNKISETWEKLINSTLFDYVEIKQLANNDISGREIVVYVDESPNQNIRIGSRIDNERNVQIGVDFIQENLFGAGSRLNLRLVGGAFNQEASLNLANSRIAKSNITFAINPYYKVRQVWMYYDLPNQPQNRYDYNRKRDLVEEGYGAKFRIGSQIEKFGILGTEFRFEKQRFYNPDSMNKPYFYRVATFKVGSDFDSRNNRYFPTNGSKLNIFLESSAFGVIEERSFSKLSFEYEFVQTISNHTFIPAFQFGAADETLPLPETFTMGGQNNFIGMMQDEMRGKQIIKASLDYRYKSPIELFFDTYFSIHYDMGSVWDGPETIRIADLRHGVGTSLSWDTPLGPLQFTVGRSFYFVSDPNTVILGPVNAYFTFGLDL